MMATMRQPLGDFLVRLGDEPELFEEYTRNREVVLEREGLAPADREVILSGDIRELRTRLRKEYSELDEAMVVMERPEEEEEPPTVMEPEEPPTVMEPEEEPPVVMEPDEEETRVVMDPEKGAEAE
jgi:hypothetical protein